MKELIDTASLMCSPDYKERFRAEYFQLLIRYTKLKKLVADWDKGILKFEPTCPLSTYHLQLGAMNTYLTVLEARAKMEGIDLNAEAMPQTSPKANTVTKEDVKENMKDVVVSTIFDFGKPTTYVTVRMKNGFTLRETTTCVDPRNYNEEIGAEICLKRLENQVWLLLGYALQEKLYQQGRFMPPSC